MNLISILFLAGAVTAAVKGLDKRLEVTRYTILSEKIPRSFENFRIIHISDFHCVRTSGLINIIKKEKPDIICASGDMTHDTGSYDEFILLLEEMLKISPVYIVSGNHDVWRHDYKQYANKCRELGAVFLQNESAEIQRDNSKICLYGIEDPYAISQKHIQSNLEKGLNMIQKTTDYSILLFHRANLFDMLADKGFDLILSGHMHGGQFRIPGIGGVVCPKTNFCGDSRILFPKFSGGKYEKKNTKMIVSRGIGNPSFLPRIFNRPQICTVILKKE